MLSIVEVVNKLLVCTDVINDGNDTRQLAPMAVQAKETLEVDTLAASGDTGYYDKAQIKTCVDVGITPYVAIPDKEAPVREAGRFPRSMFTYDPDTNSYKCPAEQVLTRQEQQKKTCAEPVEVMVKLTTDTFLMSKHVQPVNIKCSVYLKTCAELVEAVS